MMEVIEPSKKGIRPLKLEEDSCPLKMVGIDNFRGPGGIPKAIGLLDWEIPINLATCIGVFGSTIFRVLHSPKTSTENP